MKFRSLTPDEAKIALKVAGLPAREITKPITLGELFNPDTDLVPERKVGFAA